jgi:GNAT superfamily N-acetyltransferase
MSALPPGYELTDDPARIDPAAAHAYLTRSYWSPGIPLETVARAIANSLAVAILHRGEQVAMARLVTDFATMAYLADVYVLEDHRGQGLVACHARLARRASAAAGPVAGGSCSRRTPTAFTRSTGGRPTRTPIG